MGVHIKNLVKSDDLFLGSVSGENEGVVFAFDLGLLVGLAAGLKGFHPNANLYILRDVLLDRLGHLKYLNLNIL